MINYKVILKEFQGILVDAHVSTSATDQLERAHGVLP